MKWMNSRESYTLWEKGESLGTYHLTAKGTAEKPIVIKAAGDGEVIFDGGGNHRLFDVTASAHHIFEGLTFRNTDIVFEQSISRKRRAWTACHGVCNGNCLFNL